MERRRPAGELKGPMPDRIARALARHRKMAIPAPAPPRHGSGDDTQEAGSPRLTRAAVLVPLFEKEGDLCVLLTRRTEEVRAHKGQISFPGGRWDEADQSLLNTALRECEEEIGIPSPSVRILGELDDIVTVTDYLISPFVGLIPYPHPLRISRREIAEIIELPIREFLPPARLRVATRMQYRGKEHSTYFFDVGCHVIWGATAQILVQFLEIAFDYQRPRQND